MTKLSGSGGRGRYKFRSTIDVRNYEVDWQGIVHNANYLLYFETGRIAYLRHLGLPVDMKSIRSSSRVVLARNEINYRSPALFGERLEVLTRVSQIGRTSFTFEGEIRRRRKGIPELVADNVAVHVWLDGKKGSPVPVAAKFRRAVEKFEGERLRLRAPEGRSREQNRRARRG